MIRKEETTRIGYFARPHGVKGELSFITDYNLFEEEDDAYVICEMDGIMVPFFVESFRYKSNAVILVKLEDVDSEIKAKRFVNQDVFYPVKRMKKTAQDDLGWKHLAGYLLEDKAQGELGAITFVDETTMNTLFTVNYHEKELLVPVADELIESIDHETRKVVLKLPEGIITINN